MGGTDEALLKLLAEQQRTIERLTAALERMAPAEKRPEPDAGPTFGDVFKRYAKVKATNPKWKPGQLKFVLKFFAKRRISSVGAEAWAEYSTARLTGSMTEGRTVSHNTLNVELAYARAMLSWAVGQDLIAENRQAEIWSASLIPTDSVNLAPPAVSLDEAIKAGTFRSDAGANCQ